MSSANDFLILAGRDFKLCEKVEEDFPDEYAVSAASYHIQQAVEKLLKGLILLHGEELQFTHNITKLALKCEDLGVSLPECLDDVTEVLTQWETTNRYDPFVAFSEKKYGKARQAYHELRRTLEELIEEIEKQSEEETKEESQTEEPGLTM